jgi:hypothetical protein
MKSMDQTVSAEQRALEDPGAGLSLRTLRRFALQGRAVRAERQAPVEHCDMCSVALPGEHHHLLNLTNQQILCACQSCALPFDTEQGGSAKYRLVPGRYLALADFTMNDQQWDNLLIPVNMAFFFSSSKEGRVKAFYPGPAGAIESLLRMEHWSELVASNPALRLLVPDVEALLINRLEQTHACYLVPIDSCYRLVGTIRTHWRGLSGGSEVWQAIEGFFAELQAQARPVNPKESQLAMILAREGACDA